jgi:hypothetical protein
MTRRKPKYIPFSDRAAGLFNIGKEPGWVGVLTRGEAPGAIKNGTTIVKIMEERGDFKPVGTRGTVLGSIRHSKVGIGYFIEWEEHQKVAVFVAEKKIARE